MMTRHILVVLCIAILHYGLAQSNNQQVDSLLQEIERADVDSIKALLYDELSGLLLFSQPQQSIQYAHQSLRLAKKTNNKEFIGQAYLGLCLGHYYHGSPVDSILNYLKRYEAHVKSSGSLENMMQVHWMYAFYYNNLQQTEKEIDAYIKALGVAREYYADDPDIETGLLQNIGSILSDQGKHVEALPYFEEGLKKVQGDGLRADILNNLGVIYLEQEKHDEALAFFEEAHANYKKVQDKGKMAATLIAIGEYNDIKRQFERAGQLYFQALQMLQENDVKSYLPEVYTRLAKHYQLQENLQEAIAYGEKALAETKSQKSYDLLLDTYAVLQESYAATGQYEKAYEIRGEQIIFQDTTSSLELRTQVAALQTQFAVEQKEIENKLLKAETAANQQTIKNRNTTIFASLLFLLLIGSWAVVVFRSNRRKQRYNEVLEMTVAERTSELQKVNKNLEQANYELKMFNYIASHDIKEPIRNIGSYIGLIFRRLPDPLQVDFKQDFNTIKNSASQLYTIVEDFSRYSALSKDDNIDFQPVDLNQVVDGLEMSLKSLLDNKNGKIIADSLPTIKTNASFIYTILKNTIENGLKFNHSTNPVVKLSARQCQENTEIIIEDNGIGIEPAYQEQIFEMFKRLHNRNEYDGSGIGLAIVKLLMDKIGGIIKIESELGRGSKFILQIPTA